MTDDELDLENRIVTASYTAGDDEFDTSLRPRRLSDYIGQEKAKENLSVYIEAAKMRGDALDHVLLYGPPVSEKQRLQGSLHLNWA